MLSVVNAVVCEAISKARPFTLKRVRKRWRTPPSQLCVYLEITNPSEEPYDIAFELWRGQEFMSASEIELIPASKGIDEHTNILEFDGLEPKSHLLIVLLNGKPAGKIRMDFGHPEAPQ